MTADTGSCFARVTYQCVKGTFVSQWSQHRAGNRANGNLQDAEGVVYPLNDPLNKIYDGKTGARKELANATLTIYDVSNGNLVKVEDANNPWVSKIGAELTLALTKGTYVLEETPTLDNNGKPIDIVELMKALASNL